jgi:uncharacterized membrane protein (UPF0127 family)
MGVITNVLAGKTGDRLLRARLVSPFCLAALALLFTLAACSDPNTVRLEDYGTRDVTLPGGQVIRAEVASTQQQVERGLMFRTSLAPDRGMLFLFSKEEPLTFWMFQTLIPLDIIWMDSNRHIVEISPDTPPCKTEAAECPNYGGHVPALFVLELAAGSVAKHHLKTGDVIRF